MSRSPDAIPLVRERTLTEGFGAALAFHPDGRRWASGDGAEVHVFEGDRVVTTFDVPERQRLRFSTDGRWLLASPAAWDLAAGRLDERPSALEVAFPPGGTDGFELTAATYTPDGGELLVCAHYRAPRGLPRGAYDDGGPSGPPVQVLLLDGRTRAVRATLRQSDGLPCEAVAAGARTLAAAATDVYLWKRPDPGQPRTLRGADFTVRDLAFSPDEKTVAAGDAAGNVIVWDTATGKRLARWQAHAEDVRAVAFAPAGDLLATGGEDGAVHVWRLTKRPVAVATLRGEDPVPGLGFDPTGRLFVAVGGDEPRIDVYAPLTARVPSGAQP